MRFRMLHCASAIALASTASGAFAQGGPSNGSVQSPESVAPRSANEEAQIGPNDIVVNARRREESLQSVPVAVTAITGEMLERQQITGAKDLTRVAPSLLVAPSTNDGGSRFALTIRGQRQGVFGPAYDPSVGVYLGDIVFQTTIGVSQALFDLNTVQVLKGPQGTLFGRNTTGGAVLLQPRLPDDRLTFDGRLSVGNYNLVEAEGAVNLPLGEKAQLRVAGHHIYRKGYIRDITTGKNSGDEDGSGVRASLRLLPADGIESVTVAHYLRRKVNYMGWRLAGIVPGSFADTVFPSAQSVLARVKSLGFYETETGPGGPFGLPGYAALKTYSVANTTSVDLTDSIKIKNIIGYIKSRSDQVDDSDGSPLPLVSSGNFHRDKQFTNELQISGDTGSLNWIAGAYYFEENAREVGRAIQVLTPFIPIMPTKWVNLEKNISKSLFASGTYKFGESGLSATIGGRYTWDKRDANFGTIYRADQPDAFCAYDFSPVPVGSAPFPDCKIRRVAKYEKFTYNASLDYKLGQGKLIYIAHRKGYRTGGFNIQAVSARESEPFRPEEVKDYEIGAKLDWRFGGMFLRTNFALYKQDYTDIQRRDAININGAVNSVIRNAASATIKGGEVEWTFIPTPNFELSGFFNYTEPKYKSYFVQNPDGSLRDVSNLEFGGVPRKSLGITGRVTVPAPESIGEPVIQLNFYRQTKYTETDYTTPVPFNVVPKYSLTNLRMELNKVGGSRVNLGFFVSNLFDKKYIQNVISLASILGPASTLAAAPRMFGFDVRVKFGDE